MLLDGCGFQCLASLGRNSIRQSGLPVFNLEFEPTEGDQLPMNGREFFRREGVQFSDARRPVGAMLLGRAFFMRFGPLAINLEHPKPDGIVNQELCVVVHRGVYRLLLNADSMVNLPDHITPTTLIARASISMGRPFLRGASVGERLFDTFPINRKSRFPKCDEW